MIPDIIWRMLVVLAGSTAGLIVGSLIHYAFLEDALLFRGSSSAPRLGRLIQALAILVFFLAVYVLYLNRFPPALVAAVGMLLSKLSWDIGESFIYAGRLHILLAQIDDTEEPLKDFLDQVHSYRGIQDLRLVARSMFRAGSQRMTRVEALIKERLGDSAAQSENGSDTRNE